jgi:hypothetical protein
VRNALTTLPWVESDSIKTDARKRQVKFTVKDREKFNMDEVKQALGDRYDYKVAVLAGPTSQ